MSVDPDLQHRKDAFTIPEAWQRLGLPGVPKPHCCSPFRKDRSPSFSIYDQGRKWMDHGTGEGGDVVDFIARACDLEKAEALRRFRQMTGGEAKGRAHGARRGAQKAGSTVHGGNVLHALRPAPCAMPQGPAPCSLRLPPLHTATEEEVEAVASSRGLSPAAVALAQRLGTVVFGTVCGQPCWLLTDPARRIAEARRVDNLLFPPVGDLAARKAHTLRGSCKSWPAGLGVLEAKPGLRALMLVEGGPDYLAALHFCLALGVHDVLPIAMLGRGTGGKIDPQAMALLAGRRVRLYPHLDADGGGLRSAQGWARQLHRQGCQVDFYSFESITRPDGQPVKDLNDCALIPETQTNPQQPIETLVP